MSKQNNNNIRGSKPRNKGGNSKPRGRNTDQRSQTDSNYQGTDRIGSCTGRENDFGWWWKDKALAESLLSLPNNGISGLRIDGGTFNDEVPGVMALHTVHGIPTDGVNNQFGATNTAATQLFQDLTRRNSRPATAYDKTDLMIYYLAVNELSAFYSYVKRIYGMLTYWRFRNRYVPKRLFEAMGVSWDSFKNRNMEFYSFLDQFVKAAAAFPVPRVFDFYQRSGYVYSGVYRDGANTKSQLYMMVPALFREYNPWEEGGGKLRHIFWHTGAAGEQLHTMDEVMALGYRLLNALQQDQDIALMGADILRAYGTDLYRWDMIPIDYYVEPIDDNYLFFLQIHNANIGYFIDPTDTDLVDSWDITQDVNTLTINYAPTQTVARGSDVDVLTQTARCWNDTKQLCDFKSTEVGMEDWFYATRWKTIPYAVQNNTDGYVRITYDGIEKQGISCTEIICGATMYTMLEKYNLWQFMEVDANNYLTRAVARMALLERFDWHPIVFLHHALDAQNDAVIPFADWDNYSTIDDNAIANINKGALWGIWGLDQTHLDASSSNT